MKHSEASQSLEVQATNGKNYLTEREVAQRLNVSVKWLQKCRAYGDGIPFAKFGSNVRYPISEVMAFEQRSIRNHTSN